MVHRNRRRIEPRRVLPQFPGTDRLRAMATAGKTPAEATLAAAMQMHQAGRLVEAEKLYRSVLQRHPQHAEALYLLAVIALATGKPRRGADLLARAIRLNPNFAPAYCNMGLALAALARH